jgi:hypothetical protein
MMTTPTATTCWIEITLDCRGSQNRWQTGNSLPPLKMSKLPITHKRPSQLQVGDKIVISNCGKHAMVLELPVRQPGKDSHWLIKTCHHPDGVFAHTKIRIPVQP